MMVGINLRYIVKEGRKGGRGKMMVGINLRYIVSTHINITMYPPL
jgi:hypothetical protein